MAMTDAETIENLRIQVSNAKHEITGLRNQVAVANIGQQRAEELAKILYDAVRYIDELERHSGKSSRREWPAPASHWLHPGEALYCGDHTAIERAKLAGQEKWPEEEAP